MTQPSTGVVLFARASAWACAAFGLSVGAHLVGGGQAPSARASALLAVALLWLGLLITRRRLDRTPLVFSLGCTQLVMHTGMRLTERSLACSPTAMSSVEPHSGHDLAAMCTSGEAAVAHTDHSVLAMTLTHALAAVLLGLVMARGEAALWFIAGLVSPALPGELRLPAPGRRTAQLSGAARPVHEVPVLGGVGRRGPPVRYALSVA